MKAASLALLLTLCGCATSPEYTPESTYAKLLGQYPGIRIASRELPPGATVVRDLTFVRHGFRSLQLDLYLPQPNPRMTVPVVLLVHGGGWRSGNRGNFEALAVRLAARGYASAAVSYRLSGEARYPAAVDDVRAALRWLREQANVYGLDAGRMVLAGGSAGGQIASLVGVSSAPGEVSAIINIDGLSDFTSIAARRYEDDPAKQPSSAGAWFGGRYAERADLWREASPIFYVNRATPPVLFIGSGQARFSVGREEMVEKLQAHGVASKVVLLAAAPHSFWLLDPWIDPTAEAIDEFLRHQLECPAPSPCRR
ncbi:MAG: alpha/beta hydrolase [Pseudomonadota bacterium]